jgi:hypothetical protein
MALCLSLPLLAAGSVLGEGFGLGTAVKHFGLEFQSYLWRTSNVIGPLMVLFGGGRVAWKASHGEVFTGSLLSAVVGFGIFAGATSVEFDFSKGYELVVFSVTSLTQSGALVLGSIVTLIGGSIAGWKAAHGESFTKSLVFAIAGSAIAASTVAAMAGWAK